MNTVVLKGTCLEKRISKRNNFFSGKGRAYRALFLKVKVKELDVRGIACCANFELQNCVVLLVAW
jgi:hypothetical protein